MRLQTYHRARATEGASIGATPTFIDVAALGIDAVSIVVVALLSTFAYSRISGIHTDVAPFLGASLLVAVTFTALARSRGLYETSQLLAMDRQAKWVSLFWLGSFGVMILLAFLLKASQDLSRGAGIIFAVAGWAVLLGHRAMWRYALGRALVRGSIRKRRVALLSLGASGVTAAQFGAIRRGGLEVARNVALPDPSATEDFAAALAEVVTALRGSDINEIVVALPSGDLAGLGAIVDGLHVLPLPIKLLPDAAMSRVILQTSRRLGSFALIDIKREPLSPAELAFKRLLDIGVALTALLALAPLVVVAMAAVKLDSPGPVLFRQGRRGFNGRTFTILKLRTMTVMEDGAVVRQARRGDARVTRVGYWLRRSSIDELPQLWNVLRGDMSIVGPRPHAVAHDNYYDPIIENYAFRHHVKPGLTGWAQVKGYRGETPDVATMAARVDHDAWYINNWSPILDIRILLLTCVKLFGKTAY